MYASVELHQVASIKTQLRVRDGYTVTYLIVTGTDDNSFTIRAFHDASVVGQNLVSEIPDETL